MDFFAAGGFQQLFNDLDDARDMHGISTELSAEAGGYDACAGYECCEEMSVENNNNNNNNNNSTLIRLTCTEDPFVLATTATHEQTLLELHVDWCGDPTDTTYCTFEQYDSNNSYNCECEEINEHELQLTLDHLLSPTTAHSSDLVCNENSTPEFAINEACERRCTEVESNNSITNSRESSCSPSITELETTAFITREMADWEEKFLDNYIEIPELVDFLPEKTPLCTETCEHFLHESSKNLKLHRKVRGMKRSSESTFTIVSKEERSTNGYACNFGTCDKIYAKPAHLKAHLRRHMGEKPYICNWPECTWRFSRSDELARHRRSHSGVKPYKCSYCMKCFSRSDHLTKHRKVHERRLLAASKAGKMLDGTLPYSVFTVRPGRKRKNQIC